MMRTDVEFRLEFRIRESFPRRVPVNGRLRLITRRELYESLTAVTWGPNGVGVGSDEYGHYVCLWTEADLDGEEDVRRTCICS